MGRAFFDYTDAGNAERLCAEFGVDFRYVPSWGEFLVWNARCWERDVRGIQMMSFAKACTRNLRDGARGIDDEEKRKAQKGWAKNSRARPRLEAMVALSISEGGVTVDHRALDKNVWVFNCANGTVDLKTGKLRKHAQKDMLTKIAPVKFTSGAVSKRWETFLARVLPNKDVRDYLQRFIGYCLTGDVSERKFLILHGGGRNGKSVLLRVIQHVMGPYADTMAPGLLMARENEQHPAEVADLFGLRLAVASEVKQGRAFDEEQVKRVTGNDILKARRMREDWWSFYPSHKLMMAVNDLPRVRDVTASFWDRAVMIPFKVRITDREVDRELVAKLLTEAPGILAWAVKGCLLWQKQGLGAPPEVAEATQAYRESEDVIGRFLTDRCEFGAAEFHIATNADLLLALSNWAKRQRIYPPGERALWSRLISASCQRVQSIGKTKARGWRGLRVKKLEEVSGDSRDDRDGKSGSANGDSDNKDNVIPMSRTSEVLAAKGGRASPASLSSPAQPSATKRRGRQEVSSTGASGRHPHRVRPRGQGRRRGK